MNRLIALGGTQNKTPVQRYLRERDNLQRRDMNKLAMASTRQGMGMNEEKMMQARQEHAMKGMASLNQYLKTIPEAKREQAFQAAIPKMGQFGIPTPPKGTTYEAARGRLEQADIQVNGVPEVFEPVYDEHGNIAAQRSTTTNKVHKDPRAPDKSEVGTPGEFGGSKSNRFKLNEQRRNTEAALYKSVKGNNEIIGLVSDDDFVGGVTGDAISMVNSLSAQVRQARNMDSVMGEDGKIDSEKIDPKSKQFSGLRKKAIAGDRYSSALIEMAYIKAKMVDPASKITDKDFDFARRMLANGADKASIIATLKDSTKRSWQNYNAEEKITKQRNSWYEPSLYSEDRYNELYQVQPEPISPADLSDEDLLKQL